MNKMLPTIDIELKADMSDSINTISKNALNKPTKDLGDMSSTCLAFVHNFFLYPLQKYNIYAKSKLEEYENELKRRIHLIPDNEITESSVNIVGPTIESLKYNLDEKYIKEMFTNILISDMTKSRKNKVQPSFIEIIKQLSNDDAKFIKTLKELKKDSLSTLIIKEVNLQNKGFIIKNYVIVPSYNRTITPNLVTFENLQRLGIIKIHKGLQVAGEESLCKNSFEIIKENYTPIKNWDIDYDIALIEITKFGKNFIEVCVSD